MPRDITIVLKGSYTDREVKKAIRDLQSLQTEAPKTGKSFQMMSTSFKGLAIGVGAGAVIGGMAASLTSMGKAAMEDQASVVKLGKSMQNLGMGYAQSKVEDFIKAEMLATGVADDKLRPAMQSLLLGTHDVAEAQKALTTVLDISASKGLDAEVVAKAIGRAYSGNTSLLGRMNLGIDKATLKTGDMNAIMGQAAKIFGGSAAAAADTYAGRMQRVSTAAGEAAESIGYSLLDAVDGLSRAAGGTDGAVAGVTQLGNGAAGLISQMTGLAKSIEKVTGASSDNAQQDQYSEDTWRKLAVTIPGVGLALNALSGKHEDEARAWGAVNDEAQKSIYLRQAYSGALNQGTVDERRRADALDASRRSAETLRTALDKLYGVNRSILSQKIDLRQGFREGPQGHTVGKGKSAHEVVSRDEALTWAISQSSKASDLAQTYAGRGQFKKAIDAWSSARGQIAGQLEPYGISQGLLGTFMGPAPAAWRQTVRHNQAARDSATIGRGVDAVAPTVIYITQTVNAPTPAQAIQYARQSARLAALSRGMAAEEAGHDATQMALGYPWGHIS